MNSQLGQWFLFNLALSLLSLCVGCGTYLLLRLFETCSKDWAIIVSWLGSVAILLAVGICLPGFILYAFLIPCLVGIVGGHFHLKASEVSSNTRSKGEAFMLLMFATIVSAIIQIFLLDRMVNRFPNAPILSGFLDSKYIFFFQMVAPVALIPFLMWAWKNSKLRPGIDRQLKEGEEL